MSKQKQTVQLKTPDAVVQHNVGSPTPVSPRRKRIPATAINKRMPLTHQKRHPAGLQPPHSFDDQTYDETTTSVPGTPQGDMRSASYDTTTGVGSPHDNMLGDAFDTVFAPPSFQRYGAGAGSNMQYKYQADHSRRASAVTERQARSLSFSENNTIGYH
eukprot:UN23526